jgi:hypothetical protein
MSETSRNTSLAICRSGTCGEKRWLITPDRVDPYKWHYQLIEDKESGSTRRFVTGADEAGNMTYEEYVPKWLLTAHAPVCCPECGENFE